MLAVLPLLSMLVVFGLFDGMTRAGEWRTFFLIFGGVVTATGLLSVALIKETPIQPRHEPFWRQLCYGFSPSAIRAHKELYLSLAALCVFSVAVQVFFPYLIIYMQHYLLLDSYAIVLGVVLIFGSVVSVACGRVIDKVGRIRFCAPAGIIMLAGLVGMFFARGMAWVMAAGAVMMSGYMLLTAALTAHVRALTPPEKAGHFQGVRMIFGVMLPMIVGPAIGAAVIRGNAQTYVELGEVKTVPTPEIFLAAAIALCALCIPLWLLKRGQKQPVKEDAAC